MMIETLNDILGKRSDREDVKNVKRLICEEPEVRGAYDLIMSQQAYMASISLQDLYLNLFELPYLNFNTCVGDQDDHVIDFAASYDSDGSYG